MAPSGKKATAKAKQAAAIEKEKAKKYEPLFTKVYAYCHKHNFHEIVSNMMHETFIKGIDKPYIYIAEYLINLNNKDTLNGYPVLLKDHENQETMAQLNRQIQIKKEEIDSLKHHISAFERRLNLSPKPVVVEKPCEASTSSAHLVKQAKKSLQKTLAESSDSDSDSEAKKVPENPIRVNVETHEQPQKGSSSDEHSSLHLSEDSDNDQPEKDKEHSKQSSPILTDLKKEFSDEPVVVKWSNPDDIECITIDSSDPESEMTPAPAKKQKKDEVVLPVFVSAEMPLAPQDAELSKSNQQVTQAPPVLKVKAEKTSPEKAVKGVLSNIKDSQSGLIEPLIVVSSDMPLASQVAEFSKTNEQVTLVPPVLQVKIEKKSPKKATTNTKENKEQATQASPMLTDFKKEFPDEPVVVKWSNPGDIECITIDSSDTESEKTPAPSKKHKKHKVELLVVEPAKIPPALKVAEMSKSSEQVTLAPVKIEKESPKKAVAEVLGSVEDPECDLVVDDAGSLNTQKTPSTAPTPSVINFTQLITMTTETKLVEPVIQSTVVTSPSIFSPNYDSSDPDTSLVIDEQKTKSTDDFEGLLAELGMEATPLDSHRAKSSSDESDSDRAKKPLRKKVKLDSLQEIIDYLGIPSEMTDQSLENDQPESNIQENSELDSQTEENAKSDGQSAQTGSEDMYGSVEVDESVEMDEFMNALELKPKTVHSEDTNVISTETEAATSADLPLNVTEVAVEVAQVQAAPAEVVPLEALSFMFSEDVLELDFEPDEDF